MEAAKTGGVRLTILESYTAIMSTGAVTTFLSNLFPFIRDRLLADPRFLFKVRTPLAKTLEDV